MDNQPKTTGGKFSPNKRLIVLLSAFALALVIPLACFLAAAHAAGNVYSGSFTAALADKYELLRKTESQKLVLIGGSSLPFGIRGDLIEDRFLRSTTNQVVNGWGIGSTLSLFMLILIVISIWLLNRIDPKREGA